MKIAKSLKWQVIRYRKEQLVAEHNRIIQKNERAKKFYLLIKQSLIIKKYFGIVNKSIMTKIRKMKTIFMIRIMEIKFKRHLKRLRPTLDQLQLTRVKYTLQNQAQWMIQPQQDQANNKFYGYLEKTNLIFQVNTKICNYLTKTIYIQQAFRRHHAALQQRLHMITTVVWPYECNQLTTFFIKKKSNLAVIQAIIKNITCISPKIKARIIQLYVARQNLVHCIRFLQWLVVNRKDILEE